MLALVFAMALAHAVPVPTSESFEKAQIMEALQSWCAEGPCENSGEVLFEEFFCDFGHAQCLLRFRRGGPSNPVKACLVSKVNRPSDIVEYNDLDHVRLTQLKVSVQEQLENCIK